MCNCVYPQLTPLLLPSDPCVSHTHTVPYTHTHTHKLTRTSTNPTHTHTQTHIYIATHPTPSPQHTLTNSNPFNPLNRLHLPLHRTLPVYASMSYTHTHAYTHLHTPTLGKTTPSCIHMYVDPTSHSHAPQATLPHPTLHPRTSRPFPHAQTSHDTVIICL